MESHEKARDTMHPDPQVNIEPPTKGQKRGTIVASENEKDTPNHHVPYRNLSSKLLTL